MASTNLVTLRVTEEATYGTSPTTTQTAVRWSSESFKQDTGTTASAEINADRQIPNVVRSSVGASGDLGFELFVGTATTLNTLTKAAVHSDGDTPAATVTASTQVDADAGDGDGHFFHASGTGMNIFAVGEWVKTTSFVGDGNNSFFRVATKIDEDGITVSQPAGLVNAGTASATIAQGAYFDNGATQKSFSFEKDFTGELASTYEVAKGMTCDGYSLTVPTDGIITGGFTYQGKEVVSTTSSLNSGTDTVAGSGKVLSGIDNVAVFYEGDVALTLTGFSMQVSNNLRQRQEVGSAYATSIGSGSLGISGSFSCYLSAGAAVNAINRYVAGTDSSIAIVFDDGTNQMAIDLPRVRLTSGQRVAGGQNQDVIMEVGFEAFKHETLGHTIRITNW